jgi:hypothetical protein
MSSGSTTLPTRATVRACPPPNAHARSYPAQLCGRALTAPSFEMLAAPGRRSAAVVGHIQPFDCARSGFVHHRQGDYGCVSLCVRQIIRSGVHVRDTLLHVVQRPVPRRGDLCSAVAFQGQPLRLSEGGARNQASAGGGAGRLADRMDRIIETAVGGRSSGCGRGRALGTEGRG